MDQKLAKKKSFFGVAMLIILLGTAVFAYGVAGWICNYYKEANFVAFPSIKIIGGLGILSLGYILLELELIRKDQ